MSLSEILAVVAATLFAGALLAVARVVALGHRVASLEQQAGLEAEAARAAGRDREAALARVADASRAIEEAQREDERKTGWLDHQQEEIAWLRAELERRPRVARKAYRIVTVGLKWTGKTSLTLKWANPLVDLGTIQGTKIERYERTVSHVPGKDVVTEHVFEIGDWGGEHVVDAQQELVIDEIHGVLVVVDLGGRDAKAVEPARVQDQLREFRPEALKFFFGPKTLASCKTIVLFINKSDLLSGTPAEVEAEARRLYAGLVDELMRYKEQVDIRVLVGSASSGHSTHLLFSHFVEKILPRNAYDAQLLQRLKADSPPARERAPRAAAPPPLPAKVQA
jgi:hypothetical protein